MLHLPQEAVRGGGWMEKMECGCGGSRLQGLFPRTQAFLSSAEEEGLTHCPSPRSNRETAPSPTLILLPSQSSAAPAPTSSQELFQAGPNPQDLAGKGVRDGGVGDGGTGRKRWSTSVGKRTTCKPCANELRGTSLLG